MTMPIKDLGPMTAGCVMLGLTLITILALYLLVVLIYRHRDPRKSVLFLLLILAELMLTAFLALWFLPGGAAYFARFRIPVSAMERPLWQLLVLMGLLLLVSLAALRQLLLWQRSHVTHGALKAAIDHLPEGVLYAADNGMPLMVNLSMHALAELATGRSLSDANIFWQQLCAGDLAEGCKRLPQTLDSGIVLELPGQRIWRFEKKDYRPGIYEMTAVAITKQYEATRQLEQELAQLKLQNARVKAYSENVDAIVRKEELLTARIRIHDDLGRLLVSSRSYLLGNELQIPKETLLQEWRRTLDLLENSGAKPQEEALLEMLEKTTRLMGLELVLRGDLPAGQKGQHLLTAAARECMTNAAHAGADRFYISIRRKAGTLYIDFTDNGTAPEEPLQEGGGLSSLRSVVREAGADMLVTQAAHVHLRLVIPGEG